MGAWLRGFLMGFGSCLLVPANPNSSWVGVAVRQDGDLEEGNEGLRD
jgi:hypothetical protein